MNQILFNIQRTLNATEEELEALDHVMEPVILEKNEFFLKEFEICQSLAFMEKGSMRLFYDSPDKEICNDFFFENSLVGSVASFLSGMPSLVSIAAIERCELLVFKKNEINTLIQEHPNLRKLAEFILQEHLLQTEKREASLLKYSPETRFKNLLEEHPKIFKRIPLHYVASYLSITPETLSRYRTKFLV
ncbi:Crp/Fnr family transcriptional regulator [Saccharicrinis sp. FJH62]|uniref:Crp/Fnr family transcriptional regulator n=1 Tax=Saccharicrinis sp. FJH62 TaxID=3344657 RepID=UPI0035D3DCEE